MGWVPEELLSETVQAVGIPHPAVYLTLFLLTKAILYSYFQILLLLVVNSRFAQVYFAFFLIISGSGENL